MQKRQLDWEWFGRQATPIIVIILINLRTNPFEEDGTFVALCSPADETNQLPPAVVRCCSLTFVDVR
jgi:hypothetical protein